MSKFHALSISNLTVLLTFSGLMIKRDTRLCPTWNCISCFYTGDVSDQADIGGTDPVFVWDWIDIRRFAVLHSTTNHHPSPSQRRSDSPSVFSSAPSIIFSSSPPSVLGVLISFWFRTENHYPSLLIYLSISPSSPPHPTCHLFSMQQGMQTLTYRLPSWQPSPILPPPHCTLWSACSSRNDGGSAVCLRSRLRGSAAIISARSRGAVKPIAGCLMVNNAMMYEKV